MYFSKEQLATLLAEKPTGATDKGILSELIKRGHIVEGLNERVETDDFSGKVTRTSRIKNLANELKERGKVIGETFKQTAQPGFRGLTPIETGIQTVGQVAGAGWDILGVGLGYALDVVKAITPDVIEDPIKKAGLAVLHSRLGQEALELAQRGMEFYEKWKSNNPRAAKDLESVVNIASLFPVERAIGMGIRGAARGVRAGVKTGGVAGEALEISGKTAIKRKREQFIRSLVRPEQMKKVKEAQVARTTEVGRGLLKKSEIAPTSQEAMIEKYVLDIPEISSNKTFQQNFNFIQREVASETKKLENLVAEKDFIFPKQELKARLLTAKDTLAESPLIVGDAERTAGKLMTKMEQLIDKKPGKASSVLKARKEYDNWVLGQKPKAFDAASENAFTTANNEIRRTLNTFLDEKAPEIGVKNSLKKQHNLLNAMDNIKPKAAKEADTAIRRILQNADKVLGTKNKVVQAVAAAVGIGGLGAAATFAPAAAVILVGGGLLTLGTKKLILNPKLRIALGKLLKETDRVINKTTNTTQLERLNYLKERINDFNPKIGFSIEDITKKLPD